jgi:hypothetical protein
MGREKGREKRWAEHARLKGGKSPVFQPNNGPARDTRPLFNFAMKERTYADAHRYAEGVPRSKLDILKSGNGKRWEERRG